MNNECNLESFSCSTHLSELKSSADYIRLILILIACKVDCSSFILIEEQFTYFTNCATRSAEGRILRMFCNIIHFIAAA